ncbi:hypothetical protein [Mariniluteicoccus flavus]
MTALAVDRRQAPIRARRPERRPTPAGPAVRIDRSVRPGAPTLKGVPLAAAGQSSTHACSAGRPVARPRVSVGEAPVVVTRLTDRGLALVLALVTLVVMVSLGCVGATAARVMSEPAAVSALR